MPVTLEPRYPAGASFMNSRNVVKSSHFSSNVYTIPRLSSTTRTLAHHHTIYPQWGTADAQIKVPSAENLELSCVLALKPGVGQNIAMHASPTARSFLLVLITNFPKH